MSCRNSFFTHDVVQSQDSYHTVLIVLATHTGRWLDEGSYFFCKVALVYLSSTDLSAGLVYGRKCVHLQVQFLNF